MPHLSIVPQTFFLTITNPGAILGLFALFGGATSVLGGIDNWIQAVTVVTSIMAGSLMWWAGLSRLIARVRHKLTESRLKRINQVSGVVLVMFGAVLFVQFAYGLAGHRIAGGESRPRSSPRAARAANWHGKAPFKTIPLPELGNSDNRRWLLARTFSTMAKAIA